MADQQNSTRTVSIQGVEMTMGAATNVEWSGADVQDDVAGLRGGRWTSETLLAHCLEGVDSAAVEQDWRDYVIAVALAAESSR